MAIQFCEKKATGCHWSYAVPTFDVFLFGQRLRLNRQPEQPVASMAKDSKVPKSIYIPTFRVVEGQTWICLFDAWKKLNIFSQMVGKNGDLPSQNP